MALLPACLRALQGQAVTVELPPPFPPLSGTLAARGVFAAAPAPAFLLLALPPPPPSSPPPLLPPAIALRGATAVIPLSLALSIRVAGGGAGAVPRALHARARALAALARRQGRGVGGRRARGGDGGPLVGLAWALEPLALDSGGAL